MKTIARLLALLVISPLSLVAEPPAGAFLIKATSISVSDDQWVATGDATVQFQGGNTRFSADRIVYNRSAEVLKLSGAVSIQVDGATVETTEATVNVKGKRVFTLSSGTISTENVTPVSAAALREGDSTPSFTEPFPKTQTRLGR